MSCALPDDVPAISVIDWAKLKWTPAEAGQYVASVTVTRPGRIFMIGADLNESGANENIYTLTINLPSTFPKLGDSVTISAAQGSLPYTHTELNYRVIVSATPLLTNQTIDFYLQFPIEHTYLQPGVWTGATNTH